MTETRSTKRRAEVPIPAGLPKWPYQCESVNRSGARCGQTAIRGAMRCRRHARVWEFRSAGLRYLVWCLAPQLAVQDESALRYMSRELVWAHWKAYMEDVSALSPEKRFEVIAWMVDHFDDVTNKGWIKSNGTFVYGEAATEPWPPAARLEGLRERVGLKRSEVAHLLGCSVQGSDLRRLAQGYAWPDSELLMYRVVKLCVALEGMVQEGVPEERMRAVLMTPDDEGASAYGALMVEARTWQVPERGALSEAFSSKALL
jgi:hypothetical protein